MNGLKKHKILMEEFCEINLNEIKLNILAINVFILVDNIIAVVIS